MSITEEKIRFVSFNELNKIPSKINAQLPKDNHT